MTGIRFFWKEGERFPLKAVLFGIEIKVSDLRPGVVLKPIPILTDGQTARGRPEWINRESVGQLHGAAG